jgi:hypothetical protein
MHFFNEKNRVASQSLQHFLQTPPNQADRKVKITLFNGLRYEV